MNISNSRRVMKLAGNLLIYPELAAGYLRHNLMGRASPLELGLPWWPYLAIQFLETRLTKDMRVFEYGTGGSTVFFAERCKEVVSVEDDARWLKRVEEKLAQKGLNNARIRHRPFDFRRPANFRSSDYLRALNESGYSIIIIDGQDWTFRERPECFRRAERFIRPDGVIVVDDSWRYEPLRQNHLAKKVYTFESVGPCRYGVTSADIFFY